MLRSAVLLSLLVVLAKALPRLEFDDEGNLISDGLSLSSESSVFKERRRANSPSPQPLVTASAVREAEAKPDKKVLHIIHHPPVDGAIGNTATTPQVGLIR